MRKLILAVLVATTLSGCVYAPTVLVNSQVTVAQIK